MIVINTFNEDNYPTTEAKRCIKVVIPDDPSFKAILATLLQIPCQLAGYESNDLSKVAELAQMWTDAYIETDWKECEEAVTIPVGTIVQFAAIDPPANWLVCDGYERLKADYPALYTVIGDTWGEPPSGEDYFLLPDFKQRSPYGYQPIAEGGNKQFATKWGAEVHLLTASQMPSHTHEYATGAGSGAVGNAPVYTSGVFLEPKLTTGSTGGGNPHNNLHPVTVVRFIIYAGAS